MAGLPRALAPLRHRSYRLLATSLGLSLLAQGLWTVALVWQVVDLGGGPAALSLATALSAGGMLASTLLGGALADRVPQRRILLGVALLQTAAVGLVAVLSLAGALALGPLSAAALAQGIAMGLYYPAYSALVPGLVPPGDLLAANGLEGVVRPALAMAVGPAAAGLLVAAFSPGAALAVTALTSAAAAACVAALPTTPVRRDVAGSGLLADVREGVAYMVRTPWLLATLLFASLMVLVLIGPFEVLVPFAIRDQAGGGPSEHALVLAAFGIGGAVGSAVVASYRLPRRYLTVMNLLWGLGCVPMVVFGWTSQLWVMIAAAGVLGAAFEAGTVIWGTLLQRRVPPALLGRVSSLDFFVSMAFMPLSMALAGPVSGLLGLTGTFLLAGLVPPVLALVAVLAWRLPADEIAHPLDVPADEAIGSGAIGSGAIGSGAIGSGAMGSGATGPEAIVPAGVSGPVAAPGPPRA
ncbi:putative MFS family arabinose efflux permease [Geodermatophilus normandii]|uniref:Putative MFS family arabinose efflux permease n=1 Tax=Geodermatophilus normandii TaxID=1137989 RepID=A0A317QHE0_9ACTN|nr:MFS transporter [Geodermatophilus normandii]PWW22413.1 putative MFS family arabinose efflux permease [Geodermatophilus normandii]